MNDWKMPGEDDPQPERPFVPPFPPATPRYRALRESAWRRLCNYLNPAWWLEEDDEP